MRLNNLSLIEETLIDCQHLLRWMLPTINGRFQIPSLIDRPCVRRSICPHWHLVITATVQVFIWTQRRELLGAVVGKPAFSIFMTAWLENAVIDMNQWGGHHTPHHPSHPVSAKSWSSNRQQFANFPATQVITSGAAALIDNNYLKSTQSKNKPGEVVCRPLGRSFARARLQDPDFRHTLQPRQSDVVLAG